MTTGVLKSGLSPIAIEFGASSLKALQLSGGDSPGVVAAASLDTPNELLDNDEARLQFQLEGVSGLLKGAGFKGRRMVCSVSATRTFVQHLHVPKVDGLNIDQAIKGRLRELLERSPREIILKTIEIGEFVREGGKFLEILCIAMPRETVLAHMQSMRASRLEVVGIFSEHMAAIRSFDLVARRASDEKLSSVYVDLGYATAKVVVTHGRDLRFAKTIALGGRDFDRVLARKNSVSMSIARNQRCGIYAVAGGGRGSVWGGAGDTGVHADTVPSLAECVESLPEGYCRVRAKLLCEELGRAVAYHDALFPSRRIGRAVFFGGEARQPALIRLLAHAVRARSFVADPMALLDGVESAACTNVCLAASQPGWAVPVGLCLSPTDL